MHENNYKNDKSLYEVFLIACTLNATTSGRHASQEKVTSENATIYDTNSIFATLRL